MSIRILTISRRGVSGSTTVVEYVNGLGMLVPKN
jgi:hypothetical protein